LRVHLSNSACALIGATLSVVASCRAVATEDIEFVAEHLPEVAMDNRYATLPMWGVATLSGERTFGLQTGVASTTTGGLEIRGPLLSLGTLRALTDRWQLGGFVFYDLLGLHADRDDRDLQTLFAPSTPIVRPVPAQFTNLNGTATDFGAGVFARLQVKEGLLGEHGWVGGVLWQRVALQDYRFDYRILTGPDAGTTGQIDFDAQYDHVVPFFGIQFPRGYHTWSTNAHFLFLYPIPRRGVVGHITGPGFDIHGDTEDVGNGKHFGDPSLAIGYNVTYEPLHLSVDLGALASQALLEPRVHRGIERNLLLSFSVSF
jgi:hypothetical protein